MTNLASRKHPHAAALAVGGLLVAPDAQIGSCVRGGADWTCLGGRESLRLVIPVRIALGHAARRKSAAEVMQVE